MKSLKEDIKEIILENDFLLNENKVLTKGTKIVFDEKAKGITLKKNHKFNDFIIEEGTKIRIFEKK